MVKSRNISKSIIVISVLIALLAISIIAFSLNRYLEYNEKAVPCEDFLDRPDGITVHYEENGEPKSQKLSKEEIDLVYEAFMTLYPQCEGVGEDSRYSPWKPEYYLNNRDKIGDIEFHYDQRRYVNCSFADPELHNTGGHIGAEMIYSLKGEFDSVAIGFIGKSDLKLAGFRNGECYGRYDYAIFPQEATDAFWATVTSCID